MRPMIPALAIILAQAAQPGPDSRSQKWCFEREQQGAQLCEATEDACNKLRELNTEIAKSPCKRFEPPGIQVSPTPPARQALETRVRRAPRRRFSLLVWSPLRSVADNQGGRRVDVIKPTAGPSSSAIFGGNGGPTELAAKLGIDRDRLEKTVCCFNSFVESGTDDDFHRRSLRR
jgi:hypothetical protein